MQLSLSTLIVIVSLLASIVLTKTEEEYKKMKSPMIDPMDITYIEESNPLKSSDNEFDTRIIEKCSHSREKRQNSQARNGRMTYVKAILSNPKISPSRHLVEKLARAELTSPKMQKTFKELTVVRSPRKKSREKATSSKIASSTFVRSPKDFHETSKFRRFKGPRKRKRHKDRRLGNSRRRQGFNSRVRLARETVNSGKNDEKITKDRYEKSIMSNDKNFQVDPYGNLNTGVNYPGVDDLDESFSNSDIDDNSSLNYDTNYSPIEDPDVNSDVSSSMIENTPDFLLNDPASPDNRFISPEDNSYRKIQYNENFNNLESHNSQEPENSSGSRQYGFSGPNRASIDRYGFSGRNNVRSRFNEPRIRTNQNVQLSNKFNTKNNNFRHNHYNSKSENFERNISPLNSKYRPGSKNSIRRHEKNYISQSQINFDPTSKPTNISEIDSTTNLSSNNSSISTIDAKTTTNLLSTINNGKNSRTRKASRVEKSEQSMEKLISINGESSTTIEMNPKLEGIGEASAVPSETIDKNMKMTKNSKGTEQNLLAMNTDLQTQVATGKSMENRDNNTAIANETKEVAGQILNKIIDELEDLKLNRNQNDHKEGLPCKLSGSWITTQAGVRIDMLITNRSVNVSMARLELPVGIARQGLLNYTWNITGYAPFRRGGPFSLVATDNHTKSLAVFVGACRVCEGIDTVEGVWSIAREPRDCRDFQMATSIHNDIFRRTQLLTAIKEKHLWMLNTMKYTSTTAIPLTKEELSASNTGDAKLP